MRSLRDATRCLGLRGQCIAALSGRVIGPTHRGCQRPSSRNCRIARKFFGTPRSPYVSGLGRTWATFLRRSDYNVCIESSAPVGLPAFSYPGQAVARNPSPFPCGQETSRDLLAIDVRDCGRSSSGLWFPNFHACGNVMLRNRSLKGTKS